MWYVMSSTYSTWMKAAIMEATTGFPQVIQHLVHKLRLFSSGNRHLRLLKQEHIFLLLTGCSKMRLSSLLPLLPRSNFMLQTPLSSEFVPIILHIGQWFCGMKLVFSSTMSPMQKFLDILTHFWCSCKVWINSFLHVLQNSLLKCWIILHLLLQYKSGFWKIPGGGICEYIVWRYRHLTLPIINCLNTVNGWEFIIASVSIISVCRDSSSKLCPCVW